MVECKSALLLERFIRGMKIFKKDAYEAAMEQAYADALKGKSVELDNFDREHASKAIRFMLSKARKKAVLLCHRLAVDVYANRAMLDALKAALARGVKLEVYIRSRVADSSLFCDILAMHNIPVHADMDASSEVRNMGDFILVDADSADCREAPCMLRKEKDAQHRSGRVFFGYSSMCDQVKEWAKTLERCAV